MIQLVNFANQIPKEFECEITMDCCTIDVSPEHSCCCDFEKNTNSENENQTDFLIEKSHKFVALKSENPLESKQIIESKKKEISKGFTENSPPLFVSNIISFIYYQSSISLFS
jgi:hypothetical protein